MISLSLSLCIFSSLSLSLTHSLFISLYLSLSLSPSLYLTLTLSPSLSVSLPLSLSPTDFAFLSTFLSLSLSIPPYFCGLLIISYKSCNLSFSSDGNLISNRPLRQSNYKILKEQVRPIIFRKRNRYKNRSRFRE